MNPNPLDGWELVNKQRSDTKIDYSKYDWDDVFIYDETSPSCLRWKHGNGQQNHSKKFNYSTYGKDLAWGLARKYREDMVNLVEQERIRLDKMVENGYGISEG